MAKSVRCGVGTSKKCRRGKTCPAGSGWRKKKVKGHVKWVCVKIKKRR